MWRMPLALEAAESVCLNNHLSADGLAIVLLTAAKSLAVWLHAPSFWFRLLFGSTLRLSFLMRWL
jgi:hypothetical protein